MLELKKEQRLEYAKKVTSMASDIGYTVSTISTHLYFIKCCLGICIGKTPNTSVIRDQTQGL